MIEENDQEIGDDVYAVLEHMMANGTPPENLSKPIILEVNSLFKLTFKNKIRLVLKLFTNDVVHMTSVLQITPEGIQNTGAFRLRNSNEDDIHPEQGL